MFIAGSNTAFAHPIIFRRIEDAKAKNPYTLRLLLWIQGVTDTAQDCRFTFGLYYRVLMLPYLMAILARHALGRYARYGITSSNHTVKVSMPLKNTVREYTPKMVADICGINEADIVQAAKWFAKGPTLSMYCQGLNQSIHGTEKNAALINLHLATGQIGKAGTGPLSLTGQPNAMGGREVGGMSNLLIWSPQLSQCR